MKVGDVIDGKYELRRLVGRGGMGEVYEARHQRIGRRLAVKVLHPQLGDNEEIVERFLREAQAAAAIGSDHIVEVTDAGETEDGTPYLVMEYLDGPDLAEIVKKEGPFEPKRAVGLVLQLCEGLSDAHSKGIVHRDLKPENLMLVTKPDGVERIKVLDFGVAKVRETLTDRGRELTGTNASLGTPYYMAPEQAYGAKDVDLRADIYAAGVILYELLTGRRPFKAGSYNELIILVATTDPRSPRELRPQLDRELEVVVLKAMARAPEDRFATMAELAEALLVYLSEPLDSLSWIDKARQTIDELPKRPRRGDKSDTPAEDETELALARTAPAAEKGRDPETPDDLEEQVDREDDHQQLSASRGVSRRSVITVVVLIGAAILGVVYLTRIQNAGVDDPHDDPSNPREGYSMDANTEREDSGAGGKLRDGSTAPRWEGRNESQGAPDGGTACPAGMVRNEDTWGHCCWPAQVFSKSQDECIGDPQCQGGTLWRGGACQCPEGRKITVDTQNNCCWPGQAWSITRETCVGPPQCPQGFRALEPEGCEPDPTTALGRLTKSCEDGVAAKCVALGEAFREGRSEEQAHAAALFARGCEEGEARGCYLLGRAYLTGKGVGRDPAQAAASYLTGCIGGAAEGCTALGSLHISGQGVGRDAARAAGLFQRGCENQDVRGCTRLGQLYLEGRGVKRDHSRAIALFTDACDRDDAEGCGFLGEAYDRARGVSRDLDRAVQLLWQSCDGGAARGCRRLGLLYREGRGVDQDHSKALRYSTKGCDLEMPEACRDLGLLYQKGLGVAQDFDRAAELYRRACTAGDAFGCRNLAIRYMRGEGVPQDHGKAVHFYERGCMLDDARSCGLAGDQYLRGDGVEVNETKGSKLLERGCRGGNEWSCDRLRRGDR